MAHMTFRGRDASLNISATDLVNVGQGRIARVSVLTAGTTAGAVNDSATTAGVAASNKIATIPNAVGVYEIDFPYQSGLVFTPGTGMVASVSYTGASPVLTPTN